MRYVGPVYRALNPVFAREPLSGRGAELYGERFNPKGTPALYASPSMITALRKVNQIGSLQPTTLVCYDANIERIFDTRDTAALQARGMDHSMLSANTWRDQMKTEGEARTQAFSRELIAAGYCVLLVRSAAAGAVEDDLNLVLWKWGSTPPSRLTLIADDNRLSR
uniref:RES family NAD+ phosphorylase n=1 Tax=uncultured Rhizobium sp. TaxID=155567 RepID=UPI002616E956|nr:RES family NAD+ phosphorylase [uncultured Rhizobium sp.]